MKSFETVIISVHFNRENVVKKSIESVVNQLSESELLLLIDDGSTDNTLIELNKFSSENVQVISWENRGFTQSVIDAIQLYNSKYVAIHGAGDVSLKGRFKEQAKILSENMQVVVVGAYHKNINMRVNIEFISKNKIHGLARNQILSENPFSHSEVMFRRDAYIKAGGYRTTFTFAQDRDLWCRMSFFGEFYIVEKVLVERFHAVSDSVSGNYLKLLHQRYLSDFALHCHRLRLKYGYEADYNIEFQKLLYKPSFNVQKELFFISLKLIKRKKYKEFIEYKRKISKHFIFNITYKILSPILYFLTKNQSDNHDKTAK